MKEEKATPIEILAKVSAVAAKTYMDQRGAVMENPEAQLLPGKVKLLIGIGVAAALQSSTCTLMWVKHARKAGATDAEIAEAIMVSRLMKAATVNDTAADALQWLLDNPAAVARG
jgi:AhpD family alkylhydroperoxidase